MSGLRKGQNAKLPPEEEEALLQSLRVQRERVAHIRLQAEAQAVSQKMADYDIKKVVTEAQAVATKDRKNFGFETPSAVVAITLNWVLLSASVPSEEASGGKGGKKGAAGYSGGKKAGGDKKNAKPKIGAVAVRLPPPTWEAAKNAIVLNKDTLAQISTWDAPKGATEKNTDGQLALLRSFESWLVNDHNEPVRTDAPKLLEVFSEEALIVKEVFIKFWANILSSREAGQAELVTLQAASNEAAKDYTDALDKMKAAEADDLDAAKDVKWGAAEAQNCRAGNNPSEEELAREKAAKAYHTKALALKLQKTKVVEMCQKRRDSSLNTREAADRALSDQTVLMQPLEVIFEHTRSFFDALTAAS